MYNVYLVNYTTQGLKGPSAQFKVFLYAKRAMPDLQPGPLKHLI